MCMGTLKNKLRKDIAKIILEQQSDENYIYMSPEEYIKFLDYTGNKTVFIKHPKFGGKKIYITGNLDVSGRPIQELTDVAVVDGRLDISNTKISEVPETVNGYISDYGSRREYIRKKKIENDWLAENALKRENKEWEEGESDEANRVVALFRHLVSNGEIDTLDEDELDELEELRKKLENLNDELEETTDEDERTILEDKITEIEEEIEELTDGKYDIYDSLVKGTSHYGMPVYYALNTGKRFNYQEYSVGTESEMDEALDDYYSDYLDNVGGLDSVNEWRIKDCIDDDIVEEYAREYYEESIRDSPESYFSDTDFQLTDEQEERIEYLENYISRVEDIINQLNKIQDELDQRIEEPKKYLEMYDFYTDRITKAEELRDNAQEELDEIEPDTEPTDDMIEEKVQEYVDDALYDSYQWLKDLGYDTGRRGGMDKFVDEGCIADGFKRDGDYGDLNGYDGGYDTEEVDGEWFYIMRLN